ncbi:MAG: imidazole glycerol phosphate synthase subunit HisH [Pseudomonadota bacterium]
MAQEVAVIDSGGANITSLRFALERLGARSVVTRDANIIRNASHVVLPGVGAAADAMARLTESGLSQVIPTLTQPVLGICLGMQLLAEASEEDRASCLGVVPGSSGKLDAAPESPVPNMGWCPLERIVQHPLLEGIPVGDWFYFVHSYALPPGEYTLAEASHTRRFTAVLAHGNFMATQFHPERSARAGARVLGNFLAMAA